MVVQMISIKNKEDSTRNFEVSVDKEGRSLIDDFLDYNPYSSKCIGEILETDFPEIFELIDRLRV